MEVRTGPGSRPYRSLAIDVTTTKDFSLGFGIAHRWRAGKAGLGRFENGEAYWESETPGYGRSETGPQLGIGASGYCRRAR